MKWVFRLFGRPDWSEVSRKRFDSPEAVCHLVCAFVRYRAEKKDEWAAAQATWTSGYGDCEDIAVLVRDLCRSSGIVCQIRVYLPLTGSKAGHAVVVGHGWWASNGQHFGSEHTIELAMAALLGVKPHALRCLDLDDVCVFNLIVGRHVAGNSDLIGGVYA